jgi:hypothetical protein
MGRVHYRQGNYSACGLPMMPYRHAWDWDKWKASCWKCRNSLMPSVREADRPQWEAADEAYRKGLAPDLYMKFAPKPDSASGAGTQAEGGDRG